MLLLALFCIALVFSGVESPVLLWYLFCMMLLAFATGLMPRQAIERVAYYVFRLYFCATVFVLIAMLIW